MGGWITTLTCASPAAECGPVCTFFGDRDTTCLCSGTVELTLPVDIFTNWAFYLKQSNLTWSFSVQYTFQLLIGAFVFCSDQAYVHKSVMEELKRIIDDSEITKEDDALWPPPDRVGRQVCLWVQLGGVGVFREPPTPPLISLKELEIVIGDEHISFTTSKIGSLIDVNQSK